MNDEKKVKRFIKRKVSYNFDTIVKFLITGTLAISITACGGGGGGGGGSSVKALPINVSPRYTHEEKQEIYNKITDDLNKNLYNIENEIRNERNLQRKAFLQERKNLMKEGLRVAEKYKDDPNRLEKEFNSLDRLEKSLIRQYEKNQLVEEIQPPNEENQPVEEIQPPNEEVHPVEGVQPPNEENQPVEGVQPPNEENQPVEGVQPPNEEVHPVEEIQPPNEEIEIPDDNIEYTKTRIHANAPNWIKEDNSENPKVDVVVGILDSDFTSFSNEKVIQDHVVERFVGVGADPNGNGEVHGKNVLTLMTEDTDLKVVAGSLGKDKGLITNSITFEKMFEKLENRGQKTKILNLSMGNTDHDGRIMTEYDKNQYKGMARIFRDGVENKGVLFVWSNGNRSPKDEVPLNGDIYAQLPFLDGKLEKGWISVVGIDGTTNKHPDNIHMPELAHPGIVKEWSISANARGKMDWPGNSEYFQGNIGSSYAAPRVSKAAAFVLSKYPWMTNNQLRETLFTTTNRAEAIGNSESDRQMSDETSLEYGWGALNTERALNGPGAFWRKLLRVDERNYSENNNYYFTADIKSGDYYFRNNIVGDSGLCKNGNGRLTLTGKNSYFGKTIVNNGILEIRGEQTSEITTNKENNEEGVLILGDNSKIGDIVNNGTVVVQKRAQMNDYTANKGSDNIINIDKDSLLKVNSALINGGALTLETEGYQGRKIQKNIVEADFDIVGEFDTCIVPGMKKAKLKMENKNIYVEIERENAVKYLDTTALSSVYTGENIETILENLDEKYEANTITDEELMFATTLTTMSAPTFSEAVKTMTGEIYATSQNMSFIQGENVNRTLSNHMFNIDTAENLTGWFEGFGTDGKIDKSGYAKADVNIYGGMFGMDAKLSNKFVAGTAISYSYGKGEYNNNAGDINSDSVGLSMYGKYNMKDNIYTLGKFGVSRYSNRTKRELVDKNSEIKHHDNMYSAYLEFGKKINKFTPYVAYGIDHLERGSFKENDSLFGISADKKSYNKQNIYVGMRVEEKFDKLGLNAYVEHITNVGNRDLGFEGNFVGTNKSIKFKGIDMNKNSSYIGVGANYQVNENLSYNVNLDIKFRDKVHEDTIVGVGFNWSL